MVSGLRGISSPRDRQETGWVTKVCKCVTVRLTWFRARAQHKGHRQRHRERREADDDDEHDSYVEWCNPELNQGQNTDSIDSCSLSL